LAVAVALLVFILQVIIGLVAVAAAAAGTPKLQIFLQQPDQLYLMLLVKVVLLEHPRGTEVREQQQPLIVVLTLLVAVVVVLVQQLQHQLEEQAEQVLHIMAVLVAQEVLLQPLQLELVVAVVVVRGDQMA
jgi:hypothetical protein